MTEQPSPDIDAGHAGEAPAAEASPASDGFFTRLGWLFFSPGKLGESLRDRPTVLRPALLGLAFTLGSILLIPMDIMVETMRAQSLEAGGDGAAIGETAMELIRYAQIGGLLIFWWAILALTAGIYSVLFAFILGDEGRFKQYFAIAAWSSIIAGLASLLVTPLRIAARNPQLTLSPGTFLGTVLDEGYLLRAASGFDFFAIWSWVVAGILISKIDKRRSVGSAITVVGMVYAVFIFGFAFFNFGG